MTVQLYAKVSEDGYLFGATENPSGEYDIFWPEGMKEADTVLITVPLDMKDALVDHGTASQVYDDGYDAWQAVVKMGSF